MAEFLTPKERKHVSPSEIREFLSCPLRWYYRYRLGLWTEGSTAFFAMGNAVHAGLERYYISERLSGTRDRDGAMESFRQTWADESAKVDWDTAAKEPLDVRVTGTRLLAAAMDEPDEWLAAAVEETLYADVEHSRLGKLPVKLKARLDLRTSTNDAVDHKTADKTWEADKEHTDAQATAQVAVIRANFDHDPSVTFNVLVANKVPKVDRRVTRRTQNDLDRLYLIVRSMLDAEEKGVIYPNPTAFEHRHCEFRRVCNQWEGHPQLLPTGRPLQLLIDRLPDWAARVPKQ